MKDLKDFLKYVDTTDLHNKICNFRDLDFKKMSYQEVRTAISKVITFNTPFGSRCVLTSMTTSYPVGTRFYRVRTLPEDDRNLPLRAMSKVADCWEPPEEIARAGRLNRDNESLLYTAPISPIVAIEEMKISDNQIFSLIAYEAVKPINVTIIGEKPNTEGLTNEEALKARMIQDFLKHEFIRDVGYGTEYLYRISESIAKDYFDLPPDVQDAWCYPSVAQKGHCNVCFRKDRRSGLKLLGSQIASITREEDKYLFDVKLVAAESEDGVNLDYHPIGSDFHKLTFPEFQIGKKY